MPEPSIELPQVYLQPGELYLARSPCVLKNPPGIMRRGDVLEPAARPGGAVSRSAAALS